MSVFEVGGLNVALVVPEYRTDVGGGGGVATVADFVMEHLLRAGHRVDIISPRMSRLASESRSLRRPKSWLRGPLIHDVQRAQGLVRYVGATLAELEPVRFLPRRRLTKLVNNYQVAVVVAGSPAACYALRDVKVPVVLQVATFLSDERTAQLDAVNGLGRLYRSSMARAGRLLDELGLRVPESVIVENAAMYDGCRVRGIRNVTLLAPGVDVDRFRPIPAPGDDRYIVCLARLNDPRKDIPTLLRAVAAARSNPDFQHKLVLAGRNPPSSDVLELIKHLGLSDGVDVISPIRDEDLPQLLNRADLFVLASTEEGLGMAALEALASGLPIVATKTAGLMHVLGDSGAGRLVEFGEDLPIRLAAAISEVLHCEELRTTMSLKARERALEMFSDVAVGVKFAEIVKITAGA